MEFKVSSEMVKMFTKTDKNINYMLDYLLRSVDPDNCIKYFNMVKNFEISDSKSLVEISSDNIRHIKVLFKNVDDKLIEKLLWVSLLFLEV